jgi:hypothetical protein
MLDIITLCARSKLTKLLQQNESDSVSIVSNRDGGFGFHFDDNMNGRCNILLSIFPKILTDSFTFRQLSSNSIDFSYNDNDFIIKRDL